MRCAIQFGGTALSFGRQTERLRGIPCKCSKRRRALFSCKKEAARLKDSGLPPYTCSPRLLRSYLYVPCDSSS